MLELVEIQRVAHQGRTNPLLCKGMDGKSYYAKGRAATASGLIKEWMSANLAQAFGLPIPPFGVANIDASLVNAFGGTAIESLGDGYVFVSEQIEFVSDFRHSLIEAIPLELKRDLLIFDLWIENEDRTLTEQGGNPNLLWSKLTNELYVIDHNLAFDNGFNLKESWECHPFSRNFQLDIYKSELEERLVKSLQNWSQWWNKIPVEWLEQNEESGVFTFNEQQILHRLTAEAQGGIWEKIK